MSDEKADGFPRSLSRAQRIAAAPALSSPAEYGQRGRRDRTSLMTPALWPPILAAIAIALARSCLAGWWVRTADHSTHAVFDVAVPVILITLLTETAMPRVRRTLSATTSCGSCAIMPIPRSA
jgi:hypothetical protein